MASFIYPRTIQITRPGPEGGAGLQSGYLADQESNETVVACDLSASIQLRREGIANPTGLPADAKSPLWDCLIPLAELPSGVIEDRDIITDDFAQRYQVVANYYDSLGYNLRVQRLET